MWWRSITRFSSLNKRFIRVRVEIPLDKPLRWSGVVVNPKGDKVHVDFKYEYMNKKVC